MLTRTELVLLGALFLSIAGCSGGTGGSVPSDGSSLVDAETGGTVVSDDGLVTLEVSADALLRDTRITIQRVTADELPEALDPEMFGEPYYRLGPAGLQFEEPVQVRIVLEDQQASDLASEEGLAARSFFTWDEDNGLQALGEDFGTPEQTMITVIEPEEDTVAVEGTLTHFSWLVGGNGTYGSLRYKLVVGGLYNVNTSFNAQHEVWVWAQGLPDDPSSDGISFKPEYIYLSAEFPVEEDRPTVNVGDAYLDPLQRAEFELPFNCLETPDLGSIKVVSSWTPSHVNPIGRLSGRAFGTDESISPPSDDNDEVVIGYWGREQFYWDRREERWAALASPRFKIPVGCELPFGSACGPDDTCSDEEVCTEPEEVCAPTTPEPSCAQPCETDADCENGGVCSNVVDNCEEADNCVGFSDWSLFEICGQPTVCMSPVAQDDSCPVGTSRTAVGEKDVCLPPDSHEPNDTPETATDLGTLSGEPTTIWADFDDSEDFDWYTFELDRGIQRLSFLTRPIADGTNVDTRLFLGDDELDELAEMDLYFGKGLLPGRYFLEMTPEDDDDIGPYVVAFAIEAACDGDPAFIESTACDPDGRTCGSDELCNGLICACERPQACEAEQAGEIRCERNYWEICVEPLGLELSTTLEDFYWIDIDLIGGGSRTMGYCFADSDLPDTCVIDGTVSPLESCDVLAPNSCDDGSACDGCSCVAPESCDEGDAGVSRCNGDLVEICFDDSDGWLWRMIENCGYLGGECSTSEDGDAVCEGGDVCFPVSDCDEAGVTCEDNNVVTCAADAEGCFVLSEEDCAELGTTCEDTDGDAVCLDPDPCFSVSDCDLAGSTCEGDNLVTCAADTDGCLVRSVQDCSAGGTTCEDTDGDAVCQGGIDLSVGGEVTSPDGQVTVTIPAGGTGNVSLSIEVLDEDDPGTAWLDDVSFELFLAFTVETDGADFDEAYLAVWESCPTDPANDLIDAGRPLPTIIRRTEDGYESNVLGAVSGAASDEQRRVFSVERELGVFAVVCDAGALKPPETGNMMAMLNQFVEAAPLQLCSELDSVLVVPGAGSSFGFVPLGLTVGLEDDVEFTNTCLDIPIEVTCGDQPGVHPVALSVAAFLASNAAWIQSTGFMDFLTAEWTDLTPEQQPQWMPPILCAQEPESHEQVSVVDEQPVLYNPDSGAFEQDGAMTGAIDVAFVDSESLATFAKDLGDVLIYDNTQPPTHEGPAGLFIETEGVDVTATLHASGGYIYSFDGAGAPSGGDGGVVVITTEGPETGPFNLSSAVDLEPFGGLFRSEGGQITLDAGLDPSTDEVRFIIAGTQELPWDTAIEISMTPDDEGWSEDGQVELTDLIELGSQTMWGLGMQPEAFRVMAGNTEELDATLGGDGPTIGFVGASTHVSGPGVCNVLRCIRGETFEPLPSLDAFSTEVVASDTVKSSSLAIAPDGTVAAAWVTGGTAKFATRIDEDTWTVESLGTGSPTYDWTTLLFDADSEPHMVVVDRVRPPSTLTYIRRGDAGWDKTKVTGSSGQFTLDSDGVPRVAYSVDGILYLGTWGGTEFAQTVVEDPGTGNSTRAAGMTTGGDGAIHLLWFSTLDAATTLQHGELSAEGGEWDIETIPHGGCAGSFSIATDSNELLQAACAGDGWRDPRAIMWLRETVVGWDATPVGGTGPRVLELELDQYDRPVIGYGTTGVSFTNTIVRWDGEAFDSHRFTPEPSVAAYGLSITLTEEDELRLLYSQIINSDYTTGTGPRYVTFDESE